MNLLLPLQTLIVMEHSHPCPLYSRAQQHLPYYPNGRGAPGALPYNIRWTGLTTGLTIPYKHHGANNCKDLQIVKLLYPNEFWAHNKFLETKCCTTTHSFLKQNLNSFPHRDSQGYHQPPTTYISLSLSTSNFF